MSERDMLRERRRAVSEQGMVQEASAAAREAADKARAFADICDEYANCLLDARLRGRAAELRASAGEKLQEIRQAVARGDDLLERSKKGLEEGSTAAQTKTTRELPEGFKQAADQEMADEREGGKK